MTAFKELPVLLKISVVAILIMGTTNLIFAWFYSKSFEMGSEFDALRVVAIGTKTSTIMGLSVLSLAALFPLMKKWRWGYWLSFWSIILTYPVLMFTNIEEVFSSPGLRSFFFLMKVSLPLIVLLLLVIQRKDLMFKRKG